MENFKSGRLKVPKIFQSPHKKKIFFFYGNDTLARRLITAKKIFIKVPIKKKFFFFMGTIP